MPDRYRCPLDRSSFPTDQTTCVAVADSRAVLRTNMDGTLRQEDVPPDAIMLIEFSAQPRHWMSPEDASPKEIIAYIQSMQTDPTCHRRYATADVRTRPIRELEEKNTARSSAIRSYVTSVTAEIHCFVVLSEAGGNAENALDPSFPWEWETQCSSGDYHSCSAS